MPPAYDKAPRKRARKPKARPPVSSGRPKGSRPPGHAGQYPTGHSRMFHYGVEEAARSSPASKSAARAVRTGKLSDGQQRQAGLSPYLLRSKRGRQAVARKVLDKSVHDAPDKVAEQDYHGYLDRLWKRVGHEYGGKQPKMKVHDFKPDLDYAVAYVHQGRNMVHYRKQLLRDYESISDPLRREYAASVPLHEWQHTRQRKGDEGEAEYVRKRIGKQERIPWHPSSFEYEDKRRAYTIKRARKKRAKR